MPKKHQYIALIAIMIVIALYGLIINVNSNTKEKDNQKYSSNETIIRVNNKEISKKYFNDLVERTGNLLKSINKNLDGTKFRLSGTLLLAESFPTQVIYLVPIKEATLKEKQNIKNKIYNIIKLKNFSNKETFEIVFKENKSIKN